MNATPCSVDLGLLTWLHYADKVVVMGSNQERASACLALGVLQCGELWVKEEVARLLQAKLRPGSELLCSASPLSKLITWPAYTQGQQVRVCPFLGASVVQPLPSS